MRKKTITIEDHRLLGNEFKKIIVCLENSKKFLLERLPKKEQEIQELERGLRRIGNCRSLLEDRMFRECDATILETINNCVYFGAIDNNIKDDFTST